MKLSRGKINRIRNAKNQSRINMKKITKLGGSKSRHVKGSNVKGTNVKGSNVKGSNVKACARKRRYTNIKKKRAFNLRTKTIKMRQKGGSVPAAGPDPQPRTTDTSVSRSTRPVRVLPGAGASPTSFRSTGAGAWPPPPPPSATQPTHHPPRALHNKARVPLLNSTSLAPPPPRVEA